MDTFIMLRLYFTVNQQDNQHKLPINQDQKRLNSITTKANVN